MSGCDRSLPICPCGTVIHPTAIFNLPGRAAISYRVGQYADFRHALLQALPNEIELTQVDGRNLVQIWRPTGSGDLALQMMEWFAYLADVLTFYNERIATQAYLGTADLPESTGRLIQILGYRPRPALGSKGTVGALLSGSNTITLKKGFAVQSKPGPGKQPQTYELDTDTVASAPDGVATRVVPSQQPPIGIDGNGDTYVWLVGKISGMKQNDKLLLFKSITDFAWVQITAIAAASDASGNPVTQLTLSSLAGTVPATTDDVANWQILRSTQSLPPWSFPVTSATVLTSKSITLASVARGVSANDYILLEVPATPSSTAVEQITSYSEIVWYANGDGPTPPTTSPPPSPIGIPVSELQFSPALSSTPAPSGIIVRFNFKQLAQLAPVLQPSDISYSGGSASLQAVAPAIPQTLTGKVLLQGSNPAGALADVSVVSTTELQVNNPAPTPPPSLDAPIDVYFNLLPVSQGKTVANELLGSGDAMVAGQDFVLQKSPVTYFQDAASKSGDLFSSTVRVWVNGVEWKEARSFFGAPKDAQIFVLHEDEQVNTHVVFGDGANGARPPTGVNNIVASYRYGAGADAPSAGTLTNVLQPQPGLKSVVNPVAPGGGADADPPSRIKQLAPASVMTFERAVSLDDYEAIAAAAPGVIRAKALFVFDPQRQRPVITVWIEGDDSAQSSVQTALARAADPNDPVSVKRAIPVAATLTFTYVRDPRYRDEDVQLNLTAALTDPKKGLFGSSKVGIGEVFFASQIYAACLAVPGVLAIHSLSFVTVGSIHFLRFFRQIEFLQTQILRRPRFGLLKLGPAPACVGERYDPGAGHYFTVTLGTLSGTVAA